MHLTINIYIFTDFPGLFGFRSKDKADLFRLVWAMST